MTNQTFAQWSQAWKAARDIKTPISEVLRLWRLGVPDGGRRLQWKGALGTRIRHVPEEDVGEQVIERKLLGDGTINLHHAVHDGRTYTVAAFYQRLPLATVRRDQVIADAFGIALVDFELHPLMVEVKHTANDIWHAVVQNLQQVRMARANERNIAAFISRSGMPRSKGTWGMVLAPEAYFTGKPGRRKVADLLEAMTQRTQARIALATSDGLSKQRMTVIGGNWR